MHRGFVIIFLFTLIFTVFTTNAFAQRGGMSGAESEKGDVSYDEELREYYLLGIGLLLDKGQETLLKDIEDNSKILRGGETYTANNGSMVDINEAFDLYNSGKYDKAFKKMLDIARTGNAAAQEAVALMLYNGWGVSQDLRQAARWFERASRKLKPLSFHYLGNMYFSGLGVKKDILSAAVWLSLAIQFYDENSDAIKQAEADLENVLARISLREQRGVQSRVEEWINKHSAAVNAFKRRQKKLEREKKLKKQK